MSSKRRLLIIEPHSDDGVISAGGFMEKFRDRYEYHFLLVVASELPLYHNQTQTREQRLTEFARYVEHFQGVWHRDTSEKSSLPLDMDARLDMYPRRDLVAHIEVVINKVRPQVLMCTGPSFHHDHTAVYESVIAATRPTARYFPEEFYVLENPTYVHSNPMNKFVPDTYVSLSESELQKKLDCFTACFPSQARTGDNALSVEGIRSWARYRGIEARTTYAEAFQTFSRII
jgi:LmbE family N-acetylglucosaminyl deacetylase